MKIVLPANENSLSSGVCVSFGRAPYFLVRDTESGADMFVVNTAADSQGGAGIKAAQLVADTGASVVLTPRCGENSAQVLKAAGIQIFRTTGESLEESITAYMNGKLEEMTLFHAGFHGHGGK